jgi:hypothetical protein
MTTVRYTAQPDAEASFRSLPWFAAEPASSRIIGHLFYYSLPGAVWRVQRATGLRIYPGGTVPGSGGARTKILWIDYSGHSRGAMDVDGARLDAPGRFHQSFAALGPSIIDVPSPGCWHVTLRTATTTGKVTLLATRR